MLVDVASQGEATGYENTGTSLCKIMDVSFFFQKLIENCEAAEHPHLSIPETSAGKSRKQYHRLINRSLVFVSVGAAVAIVGLAAYRVYATRRNSSS
ncbi:Mitochondrial Rho GTPase 1 [Sesamum angolense]|uniref:Mitochondrial Rho GTPase 1 n=1 Tax=Sesamum angolense TaxID=2727404 RepID=A0AAE2BZ22_9LAMI|nr:Mitochondrial Rho GTPase 1 [Sesamum angolense]